MMIGFVLAVGLLAGPQAQAKTPPPPPADISAIAYHAARLTVLEQRKQAIEGELTKLRTSLGENHPDVQVLVEQLNDAERALSAEGDEWRELDVRRLVGWKALLEHERDQLMRTRHLGAQHPIVLAKQAEIEGVAEHIRSGSLALLTTAEAALKENISTGVAGLDPYLRLARLYEGAGRTADADSVLVEALAWLRARGK